MNFQVTGYEMSVILDAFHALFKAAKEIIVSHLGAPLNLAKYVKSMNEYDASNPDKVKLLTKQAQEQFLAFLFLGNADQSKYGSLLTVKNLNSQKFLGTDQYPKTIVDAWDFFK